jgi:hypothetical protein
MASEPYAIPSWLSAHGRLNNNRILVIGLGVHGQKIRPLLFHTFSFEWWLTLAFQLRNILEKKSNHEILGSHHHGHEKDERTFEQIQKCLQWRGAMLFEIGIRIGSWIAYLGIVVSIVNAVVALVSRRGQ